MMSAISSHRAVLLLLWTSLICQFAPVVHGAPNQVPAQVQAQAVAGQRPDNEAPQQEPQGGAQWDIPANDAPTSTAPAGPVLEERCGDLICQGTHTSKKKTTPAHAKITPVNKKKTTTKKHAGPKTTSKKRPATTSKKAQGKNFLEMPSPCSMQRCPTTITMPARTVTVTQPAITVTKPAVTVTQPAVTVTKTVTAQGQGGNGGMGGMGGMGGNGACSSPGGGGNGPVNTGGSGTQATSVVNQPPAQSTGPVGPVSPAPSGGGGGGGNIFPSQSNAGGFPGVRTSSTPPVQSRSIPIVVQQPQQSNTQNSNRFSGFQPTPSSSQPSSYTTGPPYAMVIQPQQSPASSPQPNGGFTISVSPAPPPSSSPLPNGGFTISVSPAPPPPSAPQPNGGYTIRVSPNQQPSSTPSIGGTPIVVQPGNTPTGGYAMVIQPQYTTSSGYAMVIQPQYSKTNDAAASPPGTATGPTSASVIPTFSPAGICWGNHTFLQAMRAGFDDLKTYNGTTSLTVNMNNISPEAAAVVSNVVGNGITVTNNSNTPPMYGTTLATYQGLKIFGADVYNSTQALSGPHIIWSRPNSTITVALDAPWRTYQLQSVGLGCSNNADLPYGQGSNGGPSNGVPGGGLCQITVVGGLSNVVVPTLTPEQKNAPGTTTGSDGTVTRKRTFDVPPMGRLVQNAFDPSQWKGLVSVTFSAAIGDQPVGIEMDDLIYTLEGNC